MKAISKVQVAQHFNEGDDMRHAKAKTLLHRLAGHPIKLLLNGVAKLHEIDPLALKDILGNAHGTMWPFYQDGEANENVCEKGEYEGISLRFSFAKRGKCVHPIGYLLIKTPWSF